MKRLSIHMVFVGAMSDKARTFLTNTALADDLDDVKLATRALSFDACHKFKIEYPACGCEDPRQPSGETVLSSNDSSLSVVWVKQEGEWKQIHRRFWSSRLPQQGQ